MSEARISGFGFNKGDVVRVLTQKSIWDSLVNINKKYVINYIKDKHSLTGRPYAEVRSEDGFAYSLHIDIKDLRLWDEYRFSEDEIVTYIGDGKSLLGSKMTSGKQYKFVRYINDNSFDGFDKVGEYALIKEIDYFLDYFVRKNDIVAYIVDNSKNVKKNEEDRKVLTPLVKEKVEHILSVHDANNILLELAKKEGNDFTNVVFNVNDCQFEFFKEGSALI